MSPSATDPALEAARASLTRAAAGTGAGSISGRSTVLDLAGGSGRNAVPLAQSEIDVTVVDRSADALATLARRADEAGVADRITGMQCDVEAVAAGAVPAVRIADFDLVLCHDVLDDVDDPRALLATLAGARRVSVVVGNPQAAVIGRALAGQPRAALDHLTRQRRTPGPDLDSIADALSAGGLTVTARRGLGVFAGRVAGDVLDASPGARADLAELDTAVADDPAYRTLAARLQVVAVRADPRPGHPAATPDGA